ncbi:SDR family NAD(P)-dependent oxidoreductase [Mycobacterium sp. CBMA247]|nr:SDR family NAD(P)-dependent oxidoreductase [Mycolicibacterium sp. CBMA 329]MUL86547.1 SDR family NAD(P)-dependent oxidoreductase [Mycolicibacterium sp. CBMA 331]MUM01408.1 SDR family NAD(P)-dependent oxidoreductase [Mycolicibacterium sp. CBMA 334]MUM25917.1 SDR family NAD(P)-dependent oxidoreductase [Mycolicibacterium sp. CBMA 295]MUM36843.1 SDR family NAD(P)-dependent oxidoreductase [Mycolicibacterium sp. CBMA 247]MUM42611.1 SDR family NAD(P)-dependent oxidoreductase [Mycolicibacterium sp.
MTTFDALKYGPWAVITGGSEGVGRSFALQLAQAGTNLLLVARKPGPLEETAELCRALAVEVRTLSVDLSEPSSADAVAEAVADVEVGLLVHNAGANTHSAEFLDSDLAAFQRVIDLNVTTPLALVHHFGAAMRSRRRGGILLVGSMAGYLGSNRHTVYGGVKAFGRIFAESLWLELRDHNVDVLELVLGVTRTPAMDRAGLNFDIPGMSVSEPDDVAREGLAALGHGPVHVVSQHAKVALAHNNPDRAATILRTDKMMRRLIGAEGPEAR